MDLARDCVDTGLKTVGFSVGIVSLFLWLIPLFPQLYENYRTKRCEGLSIFFLMFWMIGDTCNMIGCSRRAWNRIDFNVLASVVDNWPKTLRVCVQADVAYCEI